MVALAPRELILSSSVRGIQRRRLMHGGLDAAAAGAQEVATEWLREDAGGGGGGREGLGAAFPGSPR
jgi:hypothetical protein